MSICNPEGSSKNSTKSWVIHALAVGATVAAALGARAYYQAGSGKFRARVVGIIPARYSSSRFPGKPLVHVLGKPMIQVNFFYMYGLKLNTYDVGVSGNGSGTFFLKSSRGFNNVNGRGCFISIENPQAPENDIGKGSFGYYQVKSAFAMALSTLTNTKTILNLGPNRSILGTIIRPDPLLLERKGGINGDVTFNKLLPGAGEPLDLQSNGKKNIYCKWQSNDEEEPLPRGNSLTEEHTPSAKKLKKRKTKQESETVAENKKQEDKPKGEGSKRTEKRRLRRQLLRDIKGEGRRPKRTR